ncbi:hypothetical protein [Pseudonocardia charpentierae]|uniref:Uncharacterized protein n=1 Tax=Pseudonocardia charpentierae TaxID=3075545 RepID=A0ABU2N9U0_9PSEU|nr:hypothetical protein [Pseudonocardia sp. DSM 45834]MDT0350307.1 hypothetical protein [Pseudonocardia sp. DSM 45834]
MVVAVPAQHAQDLVDRILPGERPLRLVMGPGGPRRGEPAVADDPRAVGQVLGDEVAVGELHPEPVHDDPQVLAVDLRGDVEPEPVGPVLLQVHARVLVEVVLHLPLPPRGPGPHQVSRPPST